MNDSRTVVLVHGIWDTSRVFGRMSRWLEGRGYRVLAVDLEPSDGTATLEDLAGQLQAFVERKLAAGETLSLVGFSMGGLVSRYYVQRLGGMERVERLITIASPHRGTFWANFALKPGSRQMCLGSKFLADLNRDVDVLEQVRAVSIWTPLDLMVVPAWSSRLGTGEEYRLAVGLHAWMVSSRSCFEVVGRVLEA